MEFFNYKSEDGTEAVRRQPLEGHILVVEDDKSSQILMQKILQGLGLTHKVAGHGQEALGFLSDSLDKNEQFDVILMDCQMPVLDGIETTRRIRDSGPGHYQGVPIIAVSSCTDEENILNCQRVGMNGFVAKPIDGSRLYTAMRQVLVPGGGVI